MQRPGQAGAGRGARQSDLLGSRSDPPLARPGPSWQRLDRDQRLQSAVEHLHRCGSRAVGEFLAELLDTYCIAPRALDQLLLQRWRDLDVGTVAALGGDKFPPNVSRVPDELMRRRRVP